MAMATGTACMDTPVNKVLQACSDKIYFPFVNVSFLPFCRGGGCTTACQHDSAARLSGGFAFATLHLVQRTHDEIISAARTLCFLRDLNKKNTVNAFPCDAPVSAHSIPTCSSDRSCLPLPATRLSALAHMVPIRCGFVLGQEARNETELHFFTASLF